MVMRTQRYKQLPKLSLKVDVVTDDSGYNGLLQESLVGFKLRLVAHL